MTKPSDSENLYLLEFLIDDLKLEGVGKCDCLRDNTGQVCLEFQFLDNNWLPLCERDFSNENSFGSEKSKIGKSCLFSLTPDQAEKAQNEFNINVQVNREAGAATNGKPYPLGTCTINITDLFKSLQIGKNGSPTAKVLQDTYPLTSTSSSKGGKIDVYVRLSCYGKMIITQFQMNMANKTVLFKDKEGRSLYRYKKKRGRSTKIEDATDGDAECDPTCKIGNAPQTTSGGPANPNCPMQPCYPNGPPECPMSFGGPMGGGFNMGMDMGPSPFMGMDVGPMGGGAMNPYCPTQPCPMPPSMDSNAFMGMGGPPMPLGGGGMGGPPMPLGGGGMGGPQFGTPPMCLGGGMGGLPDVSMFYSPLVAQQAAIFPATGYDDRMFQQSNRQVGGSVSKYACGGRCGRN